LSELHPKELEAVNNLARLHGIIVKKTFVRNVFNLFFVPGVQQLINEIHQAP